MANPRMGMTYGIWFTDPAELQMATAMAGGDSIVMAPRDLADFFGIPYPYPPFVPGGPNTHGIFFTSPYYPGNEIEHPRGSGIYYDDTQLITTVPGQTSNTGQKGPDMDFIWIGYFYLSFNGFATSVGMPIRHFNVGFESLGLQEPGALNRASVSRCASRTIGGMGLAIRNESSALGVEVPLNLYEPSVPNSTYKNSWDRFYLRVRSCTAPTYIYFAKGTNSVSANQVRLRVNTDRSLTLVHYYGNTNHDLVSTGSLSSEVFYKIDILTFWSENVPFWPPLVRSDRAGIELPDFNTGNIELYLNGNLIGSFATGPVGIGTPGPPTTPAHVTSRLGVGNEFDIGTINGLEADFDDWTCAYAVNTGYSSQVSIDFHNGTHIKNHYIIADGSNRTGWGTTSYGLANLQQNMDAPYTPIGTAGYTTVTPNAVLDLVTDVTGLQEEYGIIYGVCGGFTTSRTTDPDLAATGKQGIIAAGVPQLYSISDTSAGVFRARYEISGAIYPPPAAPLSVVRQKANTTNQVQILGLYPELEYVGIFGTEDDAEGLTTNILKLTHNAPYYNTAFGKIIAPFSGATFMFGGTYTGNGTTQDIILPAPMHFLNIRSTAGIGVTPVSWFSWQWGGHRHNETGVNDLTPVRVWYDTLNGVFKLTVTGNGLATLNNTGTIYQVIGFSDPGCRYMLNDAMVTQMASITKNINFIDPGFRPDAGFVEFESATTATGIHTWYRGPGHINTDANALQSTGTQTKICSFGTGQVLTDINYNNTGASTKGYSVWRMNDGSGQVVWQCTSYVGNGAGGTRVINLPLSSGRYPLFALVCPHNGVAWYRDPSHVSVFSSQWGSSTESTNNIVGGGIDTISVGTSLNTNLIIYDVFVIMGSPTGWSNGLYWPYNFPGLEFVELPPEPPPGVNIMGQGGLMLGGTTGFTLLKDVSGLYKMTPGQHHDELYDRNKTPPDIVDLQIPNPRFKTGYIGD